MESLISHDDLCGVAVRWLLKSGECMVADSEVRSGASEIPDAIGFSFGASNRVVFNTDGFGGNGGIQSVFGGMQLIGDDDSNPETRLNVIGGVVPNVSVNFEGQPGEFYVFPNWMGVPSVIGDLTEDFAGTYQLFVNSTTGQLGMKNGSTITYYGEGGGGSSGVTLGQVDSLSRYNDAGNNRKGGSSYISKQYKGAQLSVYGTNNMVSAIKYTSQSIGGDKVATWDADWGASAEVTIDDNTSLQEVFNLSNGSTYTLKVIQGESGGSKIGFGSQFNFENPEQTDIPDYPGAVSTFMFTSDGDNMFCHGVLQGGKMWESPGGQNNGNFNSNALTVGQETASIAIIDILKSVESIDFPNIPAGANASVNFTLTGALPNMPVVMGPPTAGPTLGLNIIPYVSAANTVTVRAENYTGGAIDPPAQTYVFTVINYA